MKQAASIVKVGVVLALYLVCAIAVCSILSICSLSTYVTYSNIQKYKEKYDLVLIDNFWGEF